MQIKTISTAAGVNEIVFGNDGSQSTAHFYWLKNLGDSTLYVSANPNPIAEKDDVAELPAKGAVSVETDEGKIYVLGAGKVEIHRTNSKFCPFDWQSSGSGGGGAIDAYSKTESDAKYASKALYGDTTINVGRQADSDVGERSTAEGSRTTASGEGSHAEGIGTKATGRDSHAEGAGSIASGYDSHAGGNSSIASGLVSFSHGIQTSAQSEAEVAFGKYNISRHGTLFSIGDGTAGDARHNAFEITTNGGKLHDKDIATTDLIPTELPANGGNADTVGGKVPEKIFYDNGLATDLNSATKSGCYATSPDTLNAPFSAWWLVDTMNYNNQFIVQKSHMVGDAARTSSYIRNYANDVWSEWKEIPTTPIKKITFPSAATNVGGGGNLFSADFGTPITIACTSRADTQCTPFFSASQWLVLAKDAATLDPIPAGTYSFDVWYI